MIVPSAILSDVTAPACRPALATLLVATAPALLLVTAAWLVVYLTENARIPVDNPATHLELTMIHEAMILEYSGRHLALMEWAASLKLFAYSSIGLALFFPWGIAQVHDPVGLLLLEEKSAAGDEASYWIACNNFYVITRYNRSINYALVVDELARELRARFQPES